MYSQSPMGMPYRSARTAWKTACEAGGVKNARIHDVRHKSITDMLNAGIPVAKVKTAVGHSNTSTTDGYSHLSVAATREALDSLVK
jgi:site-specific recombinase XerD